MEAPGGLYESPPEAQTPHLPHTYPHPIYTPHLPPRYLMGALCELYERHMGALWEPHGTSMAAL